MALVCDSDAHGNNQHHFRTVHCRFSVQMVMFCNVVSFRLSIFVAFWLSNKNFSLGAHLIYR